MTGVDGPADGGAADPADGSSPRPVLRVVRGTPTDDELAALVTVVTAAAVAAPQEIPRPLSVWSARSRLVRPPLRPAPGAWRASAWPR